MSESIDVVCIGSACIDCIVSIGDVMRFELYDPKGKIKKYTAVEYSSKVNVDQMHFVPGGSAANIAVDLKYLHLNSAYIGKLGDDFLGQECIQDFKEHRVNIDGVKFVKDISTGLSVILLTPWGKDRSIMSYKGANNLISPSDVNSNIIKSAKSLVWTSLTSDSGVAAIQKCIDVTKEKNGLIFAGPSMSILSKKRNSAIEFVKQSHVLSLNNEELQVLTGEASREVGLEKVLEWGPKLVACTDGRNGCTITDGTDIIHAPIYEVNTKDTTGAGDAFLSGLIYSTLNNFSLTQTVKFASAFSAFECMVLGVREGFPSNIDEIFKFIETHELNLKERKF
ncbi:MAG: carbohydrate kinase family protein [Candidatus Helarchaeota archaeon]